MNTNKIASLSLEIVGDIWYNPDEFQQELEKLPPDQYVFIDLNSEGPSLAAFGIYGILAQHSHKYIFTKWSNSIEQHNYGQAACSKLSHFFMLCWRYWVNKIENVPAEKVFGLFLGRSSVSRNCILYDTYHTWSDKFLLSKMDSHNKDHWQERLLSRAVKLEHIYEWFPAFSKQEQVKEWINNCPVTSIDNKNIRDQYGVPEVNAANCALSLLSHYDQFNFELVCETYTVGTTFFPTEKTIRPIIGNKPFLVYGPPNYLKNLQKLGFRTFGSIWNEQYDQYTGVERWQAMKPIINMICNWDKETLSNVLIQCSKITEHNRNRLKEIIDAYQRV